MSDGMYVALSGALVRQTQLDQVSHNLANVQTPGFKAQRALVQARAGDAARGEHFAHMLSAFTDLSEGAVQTTERPLDVAVSGRGFVRVGAKPGEALPGGQALLMRSGALRVDEQGQLVTREGRPVLSEAGSPIQINTAAEDLVIGADGAVWDDVGVVAHLGLVRARDEAALVQRGEGLMMTGQGNLTPDEGLSVTSGALEEGNLSPVEAMVDMISLHRHFDAMQNLIQTHRRMDSRAVELGRQSAGV